MNLDDTYWAERISVRQPLVGGWILGRDPSNSYTAKSFLLFKPDGKCCTSLIIREGDAMLLYSTIRAAQEAARSEGYTAGQEAMRERAAQVCPDRTDHEWVRDSLWGRVAERMKQLIYTLPIEEPK